MDRRQFESLWATGNVKIHIDEKKAFHSVRKGLAGDGPRRAQIVLACLAVSGMLIGILISFLGNLEFPLDRFDTSWLGVLVFALSGTLPLSMKSKAALVVRNRIIRDPDFYRTAWEQDLFTLEEY